MPISDNLIMRLQGYLARLGIKLETYNINEFAGGLSEIPDSEKSRTPMHEAFYGNQGSTVHKWRSYLDRYHMHLARFRKKRARILEIGVFRGGSLSMWRNYRTRRRDLRHRH